MRAPLAMLLALALSGCSGSGLPATTAQAPRDERGTTEAPAPAQAAQARSPGLEHAADTAPAARFDGFGPLRLGMTTREAVQAWPGLYAERPDRIDARGCDYAQVPGGLEYFTLMFDGGRLVGYGGSNDAVTAPGGGRRAMREAELRTLYRNGLQEAPDRFAPGGKRLWIDASGVAPSRLVFLVRPDGVVNEWRVGLHPQVDYEQGCEDAAGD